jgi:uncharacterized protein
MRYEWDPQKDVLNQRKHGLRLEDGILALEDPRGMSAPDDRFDYSEERMITLGLGKQDILAVVSVEKICSDDGEEIIRIISVRKAVKHEQEAYYLGRA